MYVALLGSSRAAALGKTEHRQRCARPRWRVHRLGLAQRSQQHPRHRSARTCRLHCRRTRARQLLHSSAFAQPRFLPPEPDSRGRRGQAMTAGVGTQKAHVNTSGAQAAGAPSQFCATAVFSRVAASSPGASLVGPHPHNAHASEDTADRTQASSNGPGKRGTCITVISPSAASSRWSSASSSSSSK